jgi:hypothetical protein
MFTIFLVLNLILVLFSFIFMFKTIYKVFIDIKIYKIVIILIFYIFSILLLVMDINMICLADEYPKVFYERGGSIVYIIELDILSYTIIAIIYFYKKRVEKALYLKHQISLQNDYHRKWAEWYKK